jgi:hypothetical protein
MRLSRRAWWSRVRSVLNAVDAVQELLDDRPYSFFTIVDARLVAGLAPDPVDDQGWVRHSAVLLAMARRLARHRRHSCPADLRYLLN